MAIYKGQNAGVHPAGVDLSSKNKKSETTSVGTGAGAILNNLSSAAQKSDKVAEAKPNDFVFSGYSGSQGPGSTFTSSDLGYENDLNNLSKARLNAQVQALKSARDTALNGLNAQEQQVAGNYQNARNNTTATSLKNAKSFNEYLANRGLSNSGSAAQAEMNRTSNLNNNIASINQGEAQAYSDIANQRQQVNTNYANGVAQAQAGIDADYYQNLLNYNQQQREYMRGLQEQALGRYANDYQAHLNTLDPNSLEYWQTAARQGNKVQGNYTTGQQNALQSIQAGNITYNNAAALGWTVPQAQNYFDTLQAQAQAAQQAQAEKDALDRYYKEQDYAIKNKQLDNQTLLNNSNIAKNNAQIANYQDQIKKRTSGGSGTGANALTTASNVMKMIGSDMPEENAQALVDSMYTNKQFDADVLEMLYSAYGWPLYEEE